MDANQRKAMQAVIKETLSNLEENGFGAAYVTDREELLSLIRTMVPEGSKTAVGGSETLLETGVLDFLKEKTQFIEDRRRAYEADFYLASANAVTTHGELYEVDGRSNRVSAMLFGPDKVIVIAGINKLVPNLRSAAERVKNTAAPPNCIRLGRDTPCSKTGHCVAPHFDERHLSALGCTSDERICSNTVIFSRQMLKGRITVIIIGEEYGY